MPPVRSAIVLASACYVGLAAAFLGLASRRLNGPGTGWTAALLLLGTVGLLHIAHMLVTDLALLAGMAIALYGFALSFETPMRAGIVAGMGVGIAFMAKGLVGPGLLAATALGLPLAGLKLATSGSGPTTSAGFLACSISAPARIRYTTSHWFSGMPGPLAPWPPGRDGARHGMPGKRPPCSCRWYLPS